MARTLMKKEVGDEASVKTSAGEFVWRVGKLNFKSNSKGFATLW
jgi:transcription elongation GreA/GreB family factor